MKGNSGSTLSGTHGKKRVAEGASGPHQRPGRGLQHTFYRKYGWVGRNNSRDERGSSQLRMMLSALSIASFCSASHPGGKTSSTPDEYSLRNMRGKNLEASKKSETPPPPSFERAHYSGETTYFLKMADEIRRTVLFRAESGPTELRKRVFGPRSLVFEVRGPLRKRGAPYSFESGRVGSSGVGGSGREELLRWPSVVRHWLAPCL